MVTPSLGVSWRTHREALGTDPEVKLISCCLTHVSHCFPVCSSDKRIACEEEFSDSDEEGEGGRKNASNFKKAKRVKTEDEKEKDPEEKKGGFGSRPDLGLEPQTREEDESM